MGRSSGNPAQRLGISGAVSRKRASVGLHGSVPGRTEEAMDSTTDTCPRSAVATARSEHTTGNQDDPTMGQAPMRVRTWAWSTVLAVGLAVLVCGCASGEGAGSDRAVSGGGCDPNYTRRLPRPRLVRLRLRGRQRRRPRLHRPGAGRRRRPIRPRPRRRRLGVRRMSHAPLPFRGRRVRSRCSRATKAAMATHGGARCGS